MNEGKKMQTSLLSTETWISKVVELNELTILQRRRRTEREKMTPSVDTSEFYESENMMTERTMATIKNSSESADVSLNVSSSTLLLIAEFANVISGPRICRRWSH